MIHHLAELFIEEKRFGQWLSEHTISIYKTIFNHVSRSTLIDLDDLNTLTNVNAKRFLYWISQANAWSPHTHNRVKKSLSVFGKWLISENLMTTNPFDAISLKIVPKQIPRSFDSDQIEKMRYAIHRLYPENCFIHMRAKAMFYTYLYTWLRLYELINLSLEDINFMDSTIFVRNWKWQKDRKIPLLRALEPMLESYEKARNTEIIGAKNYFPTAFWGTLQHREIYGIIKKLRTLLNFRITPHMFRHTFATELAKKNLNLYNISQILWHTNLNTTKIYLSFQVAEVGKQIDCLDIYK